MSPRKVHQGREALENVFSDVFSDNGDFSPGAVENFYVFLKEGQFVSDNHPVDPDRFFWLDDMYHITRTDVLGVRDEEGEWVLEPKFKNGIFFRKASQMGASIWSVLFMLWLCIDRTRGLSIGCFWPNERELQTFVQTRLDKVLASSVKMMKYMEDSKVDSTVAKQIGASTVHFRHVSGRSTADSVPLDVILCDEVRLWDTPGDTVQRLKERYGQSSVKLLALFSTVGSVGDYMEQRWAESNQIKYFTYCRANNCHTEIGDDPAQSSQNRVFQGSDLGGVDKSRMLVQGVVLSDYLPDQVIMEEVKDEEGKVISASHYICPCCASPIQKRWEGHYVTTRPRANGMYALEFAKTISRLFPPQEMLSEYLTATDMKQFMNGALAKPWLDPEGRPIKQENWDAARAAGEHLRWVSGGLGGRNFLGGDLRANELHFCIGQIGQNGEMGQFLRVGVYQKSDWKAFIERLMDLFQIEKAVLDYLPFTTDMLELANRYQGRIFLSQYKPGPVIRTVASENSKGNRKVSPDGREKHMVFLDQYKSLLASLTSFSNGQWRIPRGPLYQREYIGRKKKIISVFDVVEGMEGVGNEGFRHHLMGLAVVTKSKDTTNKSREKVHKSGIQQSEMQDASGFDPHWAHCFNYMVMASQLSGGAMQILRSKEEFASPTGEGKLGIPANGRVSGNTTITGQLGGGESWMLPTIKPMNAYKTCGVCVHGPEEGSAQCRALGWVVSSSDPECGRRGVFRERPIRAQRHDPNSEIDDLSL
jgi:hypothetical protein